MAVYVDDAKHNYRQMIMCHMLGDNLEELHAMAKAIGIKRKWFQKDSSTPHYDICKSKRVMAVKLGAKEITTREMVEVCRRFRQTYPRK